MENYSWMISREDEHMELPPGFRFHPTDEELITHYLSPKVLNTNFSAIPIGEADFNKVEPWDLPREAKTGEKEWYFFCVRDRKYPTGQRTNRATEAGYWKATGKDKEIHKGETLIGMKKTLVFYTGRAPKGGKSDWVMHEYRLEGKYSKYSLPKTAKNEWVLSRVFEKSSSCKKPNLSGFVRLDKLQQPFLPPLIDSSPYNNETKGSMMTNSSHVTFLSMEENKPTTTATTFTTGPEGGHVDMISTTSFTTPHSSSNFALPSKLVHQNMSMEKMTANFQTTDSIFMQDQSIMRLLLDGKDRDMNDALKVDLLQENSLGVGDMNFKMSPISNHDQIIQIPDGPINLDCLWDY